MSNIDLKRLAEDREYWDSVAPEGAELYAPADGDGRFLPAFYKINRDSGIRYCHLGIGDRWDMSVITRDLSCAIPRPSQKAQEVEWVNGIPPIGAEVMVKGVVIGNPANFKPHPAYEPFIGKKVKIIGHDTIDGSKVAVFYGFIGGERKYHALYSGHFEPIDTFEQSLRGQLCKAIYEHPILKVVFDGLVDDLIAEGWTKEPKP